VDLRGALPEQREEEVQKKGKKKIGQPKAAKSVSSATRGGNVGGRASHGKKRLQGLQKKGGKKGFFTMRRGGNNSAGGGEGGGRLRGPDEAGESRRP